MPPRVRWSDRPNRPRSTDLVLWAACIGVLTVELDGLRTAPLPEAAAMALLLAAAFGVRRAWPFTALGLATGAAVLHTAAIAVGVTTVFAMGYLLPCVVLAFLAGRRSERTAPAIVLIATMTLTMLAVRAAVGTRSGDAREALTALTDWAGALLVLIACLVAPWLLGRYWRQRAELRTAGWEIAARMERARDADAERARWRERSRIATAMHDSLGHDLALIAVRAAAMEMAADGQDQRPAASELRATAHGAALRLRTIIGVLREDADGAVAAEPPDEDVAAVVERAVDAGMPVRLVREGSEPAPGSAAGRTVHRVVQEALTNAAKHAPGTRVTVRLVSEDDATTVHVVDTGPAGSAARAGGPGNGSGLAGLRAAVHQMGGSFDAGPVGDGERPGFGVRAVLPRGSDTPAPQEYRPHAGATETARRWQRVRSGSRRRLATALVLPLGLTGLVTALGALLLWFADSQAVLPREDYARMSVGDHRDAVQRVLPLFDYRPGSIPGEPPAPPGSHCEYYLVTDEQGLHPVYRLCFADGRLAAKDEIARQWSGAGR